VWYKYLVDKMKAELNFQQSKYDPCVLWNDGCLIVIYTDDTIITGSNERKIDETIEKISKIFKITSEDSVDDFLGVNVARRDNGTICITQPKLIQSILDDLGLAVGAKTKSTPAASSKILQQHLNSPDFNESWHYRSVSGKLNYLEKSTRPDIAYAVHQCARFASNPKFEHGKAVKHIGQYLLGTKDKGIECKPTKESVESYADADFAGKIGVSKTHVKTRQHPDHVRDTSTNMQVCLYHRHPECKPYRP
jgi:Reverse transcriptase (RNA-dependent DNA polymerase)